MMAREKGNKGFLKNKRSKKMERYSFKFFFNNEQREYKKKRYTYVALDSCILIDMMKVLTGTAQFKKSPQYYSMLSKLMKRNIFNKDHSKNPRGDLVFCVLPHVLQEISNEDGEIHASMKKFIEKQTVILDIAPCNQKNFDKKISRLSSEYCNKGFFLDEENAPTVDSLIVAEASFFNLTLLSRDRHICINFKDKSPKEKIRVIKEINRKAFSNNFDGAQAEPKRIEHFLNALEKGEDMPKLRNEDILISDLQQFIWGIDHNGIAKEKE